MVWKRTYQATLKSIIPLPDPETLPNNASHPNSYPIFPVGSAVMALYPDTSCFYRAEVTEVIRVCPFQRPAIEP